MICYGDDEGCILVDFGVKDILRLYQKLICLKFFFNVIYIYNFDFNEIQCLSLLYYYDYLVVFI